MNSTTMAAAITAAVVSLIGVIVNVFWTYRLSSRARLEEWRRNEERPLIARMLTLSEDALSRWHRTAHARRTWIDSLGSAQNRAQGDAEARHEAEEHWRTGSELYDKLRFESAQLDLTAGPALRGVAGELARVHESLHHCLRPASPRDDPIRAVNDQNNKIVELHGKLVEEARADLGLGFEAQLSQYRPLMASPHQE